MPIHPEDYHEFEAAAYIISDEMQDAGLEPTVEADGTTVPKIFLPVIGRARSYYFKITIGQNGSGYITYNIYWKMKGTKNRRMSVDGGSGPRSDGKKLAHIVHGIYAGEY